MKIFVILYLGFNFFLNSFALANLEQLPEGSLLRLLTELESVKSGPDAQACDRSIKTTQIIGKKGKELKISVVSLEYLQEIFNYLKSQKHIPFRYPEDGCYARAHEMSRLMDAMGITSVKTFIEGDLRVETPNSPKGYVEWWFHVAPVVMVKNKSGEFIPYVIDPSIFNRPVPADEWYAIQVKHNKKSAELKSSYFTPRYSYFPSDDPELKDYKPRDIKEMNEVMENYLKIQLEREEKKNKEI